MRQIQINFTDSQTYEALRVRAEQRGVSLEEEALAILKEAVHTPIKLGEIALRLFGEEFGAELEIPTRETTQPIDFSK